MPITTGQFPSLMQKGKGIVMAKGTKKQDMPMMKGGKHMMAGMPMMKEKMPMAGGKGGKKKR